MKQNTILCENTPLQNDITDSSNPLKVVTDLCENLNSNGILYCHWKSNEHLRQSLTGLTDLDILVARGQDYELHRILNEVGFKRFSAVSNRHYHGIEDYLALDTRSGRLVHLHLHHGLIVGEKYLKGYHLLWERQLLSTRHLDVSNTIFIADPNMEMLLLLTRFALKIRHRDLWKNRHGRDYLGKSVLAEFRWLQERIKIETLETVAAELFPNDVVTLITEIATSEPTLANLQQLRTRAWKTLRQHARYGVAIRYIECWKRELWNIFTNVNARYLRWLIPTRRINPNGGLIIAVLGSDGAGKSTLLKSLTKWLGGKLDVYPTYLGSGDGTIYLPRRIIRSGLRLRHSLINGKAPKSTSIDSTTTEFSQGNGRQRKKLSVFAQWLLALTLAEERQRKVKKAWKARERGMIVIADRYPQNQIMGFNDGPLLNDWRTHSNRWIRRLAQWEFRVYELSQMHYTPDLVIKLHVTPEIAVQRKSDMDFSGFVQHAQAIEELSYPEKCRIININADQDIDSVFQQAQMAIWEQL